MMRSRSSLSATESGRGEPRPASAGRTSAAGARTQALTALLAWEAGRSETLASWLDKEGSGGPDQALARELALGAMTWARLYDALADRFLTPGRQPPALRWDLRLMAHQLFALDRIPVHAAVDETVEALREQGERHLVGVANAVGRKLGGIRLEQRVTAGPLGRLAEDLIPTALAVRHSLPDLLVDDLRAVLPGEDVEGAYAQLNHLPPLCTRTRPGADLIGRSIIRREGPWTWWEDPAEALALVKDGRCVVQDRAQGEVSEMARVRPGERVLDLCAAPGGKSRALVDAGAQVFAADVSRAKVRDLVADLAAIVQDGCRPAFAPGSFDLVLVDAPCSNSGVLARRPEARWRYDRSRLGSLEALQKKLIRAGAELVTADGRLLYSTCSLAPRENQLIAQRLAGWRVLAERLTWPGPWHLGGYACLLVRS